jgi:hypothetical protein
MGRSRLASYKPQPLSSFPSPVVIEQTHGVCAEVGENANKFYRAYLEQSGSKFRCRTHYGRVGYAGKEEQRGGPDRFSAEEAYRAVVEEKFEPSGKYSPIQILAHDGQAPVAKADHNGTALVVAAGKAVTTVGGVQKGGRGVQPPPTWSPAARTFYAKLLNEATVLVETGMQATSLSAAGFMTPLGLVGDSVLADGQAVLVDLADAIRRGDRSRIDRLNSQFFRRIPTEAGMKLSAALIDTSAKVAAKDSLLDSARGLIAAQAGSMSGQTSASEYPVLLEDATDAEVAEVVKLIRSETCRCHGDEIRRVKPRQVFRVTRAKERVAFRDVAKRLGAHTVQTLFHGTRRTSAAGCLSRGLLPTEAALASGGTQAGAAFGSGVYGASNFGKASGYTGGAPVGSRVMFVTLFAMGKAHEHTGRAWGGFQRKAGYDSVWAKGGLDLIHDECIVPRAEQAAIAFVMEI